MSRWILSLFFCSTIIGVCSSVNAQEFRKEALDSLLNQPNRGRMPGFAVRILKNNEVIYTTQFGMANTRKRTPMSQTSIMNIGSVTKQFTAYTIYLLEERGLLLTTDDIHTYLPELPDFGQPITLKHLLAHTSGLRDYPDLISLLNQSNNRNLQYSEMVEFLQTHKELNFNPGTQFCYSNTGYMMLAAVIERVSKLSYAQFLKQEVFDPLNMKTAFVNEGILSEQADGTSNYLINEAKTKAFKSRAHRDVIGATGVFCSLEDLSAWNQLFVNHETGRNRSAVIAKMESGASLSDGSSCHYGGGLILKNYRGERVVEHSGGWGEYLTQYRRFPAQGITIMIVTNSLLDSPFEICDNISNLLIDFEDHNHPEPLSFEGLSLAEMNGTYLSEDNIIRHVTGNDSTHQLRVYNSTKTVYSTYSLQTLESLADQTTGLFFADSAGNELVFHLLKDNTKQFIWYAGTYFQTKRIYTAVTPFTAYTPSFQGKYYSKEMHRTVKVKYNRRKQELVLVLFRLIRYRTKPVGQSVFQLEIDDDPYIIRFVDNAFVFGNDWVYNLKVERK
ncbi:MAG: serine hydrolase [Fluviicola sp.]|nr:serine hydrolase [Fluviicola sp.]